MKNSKIQASFDNKILIVTFLDGAIIDIDDLIEIYSFANERANGKRYGALFEALNHYVVTDSAIEFIKENPYNVNVLAKAYITNSDEAERKLKAHLLFDHPQLRPYTFKTRETALKWLTTIVNNPIV